MLPAQSIHVATYIQYIPENLQTFCNLLRLVYSQCSDTNSLWREERFVRLHLFLNSPSKAASTSSSEGVGLFLSRVYIDMTKPGVQNPH